MQLSNFVILQLEYRHLRIITKGDFSEMIMHEKEPLNIFWDIKLF